MFITESLVSVRARLTVAGKRERTIAEYLDEAEAFVGWFEETHGRSPEIVELTVVNVDLYILALMDSGRAMGRPWAVATKNHHVRQLRAFGGHLARLYSLPLSPLAGLSGGSNAPRRGGDAISDEEILAAMSTLDPSVLNDQVTRAALALGYENGPRSSELTAFQVTDFAMASRGGVGLGPVITVTSPAKGGRKRILPLGVRAEEIIRELIGNRKHGPLFPSRRGDFLSVNALDDRLARAGARVKVQMNGQRLSGLDPTAGIQIDTIAVRDDVERVGIELNPQRLRRSAASWQAAYGASSGHLDTVFGWLPDPADVKSGHYVIPTTEQLLYAHQSRLSPLDRLELRTGVVLA